MIRLVNGTNGVKTWTSPKFTWIGSGPTTGVVMSMTFNHNLGVIPDRVDFFYDSTVDNIMVPDLWSFGTTDVRSWQGGAQTPNSTFINFQRNGSLSYDMYGIFTSFGAEHRA